MADVAVEPAANKSNQRDGLSVSMTPTVVRPEGKSIQGQRGTGFAGPLLASPWGEDAEGGAGGFHYFTEM